VNEKSGISVEMSIRLSKAFGSRPQLWLGLQMEYDLAQAAAGKIKVQRITGTSTGGHE
jgi:addiction module HigA family antidote